MRVVPLSIEVAELAGEGGDLPNPTSLQSAPK